MLLQNRRPQHSRIARVFSAAFFLLILLYVLFPPAVFAHRSSPGGNGPGIKTISAGFHGKYQNGNWIPVQVTLANTGSDFSGKISITVSLPQTSNSLGAAIYQTSITLPAGSQKQTTLYIPFNTSYNGNVPSINVDLLDTNGHKVDTQTTYPSSLNQGDLYVGILSDQKSSFGAINAVHSTLNTSTQVNTELLDASTFPANAAVLKNFDMLVLDNFTTSALSREQLAALQSWVSQGGSLVVTGGAEWKRTLAPLPTGLLPVSITGVDKAAAGTHLLPVGGPTTSNPITDTLPVPVDISVAETQAGSNVLLSSGNTPLIVEGNSGQGSVYYLAFDPALAPLVSWSNSNQLWSTLIVRTQADKLLSNNSSNGGNFNIQATPGYNSNLQQLLVTFTPNTSTAIWIILVLLLGYVLVLGPLRLLLVRRLKKRSWSWRIVLVTIVLFTLLSYGLAIQQKGTAIVGTSISVIQLSSPNSTGSSTHMTNYMGVFVPNQGDFHVLLPNTNLVQSADDNVTTSTNHQTTINAQGDGTDVNLQGVDTWTLRSFVSQQDQHIQGGIVSHLTLQNNTVTGTVTNTLPYALNNTYVLVDNDYVSVGHLSSGQSRSVSVVLQNSLNNTQPQLAPLADRISGSYNIQPQQPYYMGQNQPRDELHRQMALLTTVGNGICGYQGPCIRPGGVVIINKGTVGKFIGGGMQGGIAPDPLLLPGAAATFIGWPDTSSSTNNQLNVNGSMVDGIHETLLQAPLSIQYAGSITIPSNLITGQVVDVQQSTTNNVQKIAAQTYTLTTGSMTFEYTLPGNLKVQNGTLTITDTPPTSTGGYYGPVPRGPAQTINDINYAQCSVYNWQTEKWDNVTFVQNTLTLNNTQAYIDPQGHILLQVGSTGSTQSTIAITQPNIQFQGNVAN